MISRNLKRRLNNKNLLNGLWPWLIVIAATLVILAPQIVGGRMIVGEDCWFHMNRAYEDMEQFKTGHFSYFLNLFSFNSSGRIVNGFYGPLGGYLEGLLLLIVKDWYRWEIVNSFLALVISGISIYYVARKLRASFWPSILAGVLYLASFPFNRWVLNQNFDGIGAVLLPWFLLAGYRIFQHRFNLIKLALLVTITSQIHLMSTIIGIIFLFISFTLANCYPGRLKVWLKVFEATCLTLLLTVNIWGALLEAKSSNHLVPPFPYHNVLSPGHALYARILLHPVINHVITELVIFLALGIIWILLRKIKLTGKFFAIQGLIFIWLSSRYFPWALILKHYSMLASYLQFPERFLPIAIGALLLLVTQLRPKWLIIILLVFMAIININFDVRDDQNVVNSQYHQLMRSSQNVIMKKRTSFNYVEKALHSNNPETFVKLTGNRVPDYMPGRTPINQSDEYYQNRPDIQNFRDVINNRLNVKSSVVGRNIETLTFNARPGRRVKIPFVKYAHTNLWLNHRPLRPRLNRLNVVSVRPTQRHNVLEAQYQPSPWYGLLVLAEIFTWLSLIISRISKHLILRRV